MYFYLPAVVNSKLNKMSHPDLEKFDVLKSYDNPDPHIQYTVKHSLR